jgi:UDP-glucose 4-epimerase
MRILITGGFGFVGGRLAQHLQQIGHQIVLGSRNASRTPVWISKAQVVKTIWDDESALEQICSEVDVVIHAAGMNAQDSAANPVAALEINGLATARLVNASSRAGVKRFIYLSTAHVYDKQLIGTISEDACPRNLHPYATSHIAGENAVLSASQCRKFKGIVLRLSNAYGTPVDKEVNCWNLLVNDLCRQAVQTGKMVLRSSGLQYRDFIAMSEVCRVVEGLSSREYDSASRNVFNVGSGRSQSLLEMAHLIQQRCEMVLGFQPELSSKEIGEEERNEILEYQIARLAKIEITVGIDNGLEIDRLLEFCHASFN